VIIEILASAGLTKAFPVVDMIFLKPAGQFSVFLALLTNLLQHELRKLGVERRRLREISFKAAHEQERPSPTLPVRVWIVLWTPATLTFLATLLLLADPLRRLVYEQGDQAYAAARAFDLKFWALTGINDINRFARNLKVLGNWVLGISRICGMPPVKRILMPALPKNAEDRSRKKCC